MSTLTIKLSEIEVNDIEILKILLNKKTSTGCIRKVISKYGNLEKSRDYWMDE